MIKECWPMDWINNKFPYKYLLDSKNEVFWIVHVYGYQNRAPGSQVLNWVYKIYFDCILASCSETLFKICRMWFAECTKFLYWFASIQHHCCDTLGHCVKTVCGSVGTRIILGNWTKFENQGLKLKTVCISRQWSH